MNTWNPNLASCAAAEDPEHLEVPVHQEGMSISSDEDVDVDDHRVGTVASNRQIEAGRRTAIEADFELYWQENPFGDMTFGSIPNFCFKHGLQIRPFHSTYLRHGPSEDRIIFSVDCKKGEKSILECIVLLKEAFDGSEREFCIAIHSFLAEITEQNIIDGRYDGCKHGSMFRKFADSILGESSRCVGVYFDLTPVEIKGGKCLFCWTSFFIFANRFLSWCVVHDKRPGKKAVFMKEKHG
jgi:hypothetical protein